MLRSCFAGLLAAGLATGALAKTPMHKASVAPHANQGAACLDNSRLLSHIAYTVSDTQPDKLRSCSQLLSTGTLLQVRRWGST